MGRHVGNGELPGCPVPAQAEKAHPGPQQGRRPATPAYAILPAHLHRLPSQRTLRRRGRCGSRRGQRRRRTGAYRLELFSVQGSDAACVLVLCLHLQAWHTALGIGASCEHEERSLRCACRNPLRSITCRSAVQSATLPAHRRPAAPLLRRATPHLKAQLPHKAGKVPAVALGPHPGHACMRCLPRRPHAAPSGIRGSAAAA